MQQNRRTGWWMAGVRDPESVAEHAWRTPLIASVIAQLEGADPTRAARGRWVTETGKRLADELLNRGSLDWLRTALGEKPWRARRPGRRIWFQVKPYRTDEWL
nr:HD domain-containing protein [Streptomyces antimycoticus]